MASQRLVLVTVLAVVAALTGPLPVAQAVEPMVIHGTITGPGGAVLTDAYVEIEGPTGRGFGAEPDGQFTFGPAEPGDYRVRASGGTDLAPEYYDGAPTAELATVIHVTEGATLPAVTIELAVGGRIEGTLTGGGAPRTNLVAQAYRFNPDSTTQPWDYMDGAFADATGHYSVRRLPAGDYRVIYRDQSSPPRYLQEIWNGVQVTEGVTTPDIDADLTEGGHVMGTVTGGGQPLAGVAVDVLNPTTNQAAIPRVYTNSLGKYDAPGLTSGDYKVLFQPQGGMWLPEYHLDAATPDAATAVPVVVEQSTSVDAELAPAGAISGLVHDDQGVPVSGISVIAYSESSGSPGTWESVESEVTDASGVFTIRGLHPGLHRIEIVDNDQRHLPEFYRDQPTVATATSIMAVAGDVVPLPETVVVTRGARIAGTVSAPSGVAPLVAAYVLDGEWTLVDTWPVEPGGSYELVNLAPGTYRVGFRNPSTGMERFWQGASTLETAANVELVAGQLRTGIDGSLLPLPPPSLPRTPTSGPVPVPPPPAPTAITVSATPKLRGTAKVGATLKAVVGTLSPASTTLTYRWLADGKKIKRAVRAKLKLVARLRGKRVKVRVTAVAPGLATVVWTTRSVKVR